MEQLQYTSAHEVLERLKAPQPIVVSPEGGPCSGKTTWVEHAIAYGQKIGKNVVVLEEAAGKHINALPGGAEEFVHYLQNDRARFVEIEIAILTDIIESIKAARETYKNTDTLIITDRASIKAYVSDEEYQVILEAVGHLQSPHVSLVDIMIYLPSVVRESEEKYEELKRTNSARYETAEEARRVCEANFEAIKDHPELHVFWGGSFEDKILSATELVMNPTREIEAKFEAVKDSAVESMLEAKLEAGDYITSARIEQSYHVLGDIEYRLRKNTNENGAVVYYCSFKTIISSDEKQEVRQTISQADYELLAQETCIGRLEKTRHSFFHTDESTAKKRVWVADEYNYEERLWNLEIEVSSIEELEAIELPTPGLERVSYSARDLAIVRAA